MPRVVTVLAAAILPATRSTKGKGIFFTEGETDECLASPADGIVVAPIPRPSRTSTTPTGGDRRGVP